MTVSACVTDYLLQYLREPRVREVRVGVQARHRARRPEEDLDRVHTWGVGARLRLRLGLGLGLGLGLELEAQAEARPW